MSREVAMPSTPKDYAAQERKWRAEADLRTLTEAESVKREPARFRAAQAEARKQVQNLSKVAKRK
jgi:hypothetical protein